MGTCTIIATGHDNFGNHIRCFVPLREALDMADEWKRGNEHTNTYRSIRVFSEGQDGNLTLIYVAK